MTGFCKGFPVNQHVQKNTLTVKRYNDYFQIALKNFKLLNYKNSVNADPLLFLGWNKNGFCIVTTVMNLSKSMQTKSPHRRHKKTASRRVYLNCAERQRYANQIWDFSPISG